MNKNLLLELFCEDIPSSYLLPATLELKEKISEFFRTSNLANEEICFFFTPRRIALTVNNLATKQPDSEIFVVGPSLKIAFENKNDGTSSENLLRSGTPTKALEGFLKKNGASKNDLFIQKSDRGEFVCIKKFLEGKKIQDLVSSWLPGALSSLKFPKTMRWETSGFRFPRPLRNIVLTYGDEIIPLEIAGVKSTSKTRSSHFTEKSEFNVTAENYREELRKNKIIADHSERKTLLSSLLENKCSDLNGTLIRDEDLLDEVSNLVEYPVLVTGRLPKEYMNLPSEIITTALKSHQRDFSVAGKDGGLLPHFIYVADGISSQAAEKAVRGNETIVGSRLEDAFFFFLEDTKIPFENFMDKLGEMTYMKGIGSLKQKTERLTELVSLVKKFCPDETDSSTLERASLLCKCDMATSMIRDGKEFTSLQGVIGSYYALKSGESDKTAAVIRDHYLETASKNPSACSDETVVLGITDKMDHLCGFISKLGAPSGSADPYALRKAANLIIQFLLEKKWHADFESWIKKNLDLYFKEGLLFEVELKKAFDDINVYLLDRTSRALKDRGIRYDVAEAALSVSSNDCFKAFEIASALSKYREQENFIDLVIVSKRTERILEDFEFENEPAESFFELDHEKNLYSSLNRIRPMVEKLLSSEDYSGVMDELLKLKKPIDSFFDNVMVNVEDKKLTKNRKALLYSVSRLFRKLADLGKIVIEGTEKNQSS